MGWLVYSNGSIEFPKDTKEIQSLVFSKMKLTKDSYGDSVFEDVQDTDEQIWFKMSGNKGVDYDPLEEIKKYILEKLKGKDKTGFIIATSEFTESDGGFYYEYE